MSQSITHINPAQICSLADCFLQQASRHAMHPAIVGPHFTLSYSQLVVQARNLAINLQQKGIRPEEPVAILMGPAWSRSSVSWPYCWPVAPACRCIRLYRTNA
nr:AMP-binding protein [Pantoea coffeiphila]